MSKVIAELDVLRAFIDFVNRQIGVYFDCLAGFEGNKVRIERQVARVLRPVSRRCENGQPVIVHTSLEDPTRPDVIHHRTIRADDFIKANAEAGFNEQQVCWSIMVFMYAYWDEEIRPKIATIRGVNKDDVRLDVFGDLRILRHNIMHRRGIIDGKGYNKLKVFKDICRPDTRIALTHDEMHRIFVGVKNAIGRLILHHTGHLAGAPKPEDIIGIGIERGGL